MIRALADRVILAEGVPRAAIATGTGAVGALAMPPFGIWPALAVSFTAAIWLLDGSAGGGRVPAVSTLRRAALAGWFWGLGYFVAGLWWLGSAFLVEADLFAWLMPFGVLGLPAYLALYPAFGFALARALWSPGSGRLFALAGALTVAEWLRGHLLTGFPWNAFGLAFGQNPWLMQSASLFGMWGLTVLAVLVLSTPAVLGTGRTFRARFLPVGAAAIAIAALAGYGAVRLPAAALPTVPGVKFRIVQPDVPQDTKFRPSNGPAILRRYLDLSTGATGTGGEGLAGITHLVWPESAFPFLLHREPDALAAIAAVLPKGASLITGAARQGDGLPGESGGRYFNAIQAVDSEGAITSTYDKVHLVPFGEYVPHVLDAALRAIGIRQFVQMPGGFTAGDRHRPMRVAGLPPIAASVCYEAIFPDEVLPDGPRPGLILNVTNDGWFGNTPGPYQHFAQARLRAVEQGLPLVRAANTGISAVVDPYGRVVASLGLGRDGALDADLPVALPSTLNSIFGPWIATAMCTLCILVAIAARWEPDRSPRQDDFA